jgi:hypothetical protein
MSGNFQLYISFSGLVILKNKIFKWLSPIFAPLWNIPPLKRTWPFISTNLNSFHARMICTKIEIDHLVLEKNFFFKINTCKYSFPYCGPIWPTGIMIWTNLNLHYVRKLLCTSKLFWHSRHWEKRTFFNEPTLFFFLIISSLKRTWPFIWTILNFLHPRMYCKVWLKVACWF